MPTTTNYGWTTPADTDLVKDGAAAIRTLGSSIDTTVFANASAGIPKTIVDAKGDLIAGTASDTVLRLAVGTNGQVLLADSAEATGLKWGTPASGSMTLLSTTSLSGASVTVSSISQSYKNIMFRIKNAYTAGNENYVQIRFNSDTGANYSNGGWVTSGNYSSNDNETALIIYNITSSTNSTTNTIQAELEVSDYTNTGVRIGTFLSSSKVDTSVKFLNAVHRYKGTSALSSITIATGSTFSGGTVEIWGIN
jgi:hypothetical protein